MHSLFSNSDFMMREYLKINTLSKLTPLFSHDQKWSNVFKKFSKSSCFESLESELISEYASHHCFPPPQYIFRSFELSPLKKTKVVILGQDPYHGFGLADGLAFSVPNGMKAPPSLKNIFKEMSDDIGGGGRETDLSSIAEQGVLLLNTCLTVRNSEAGSHRGLGWEVLIDLIIEQLNDHDKPVCFILWGKDAIGFEKRIDSTKHKIFKSVHPSPLSAYRGFFGSKPFSNVNNAMIELGYNEINWLM